MTEQKGLVEGEGGCARKWLFANVAGFGGWVWGRAYQLKQAIAKERRKRERDKKTEILRESTMFHRAPQESIFTLAFAFICARLQLTFALS